MLYGDKEDLRDRREKCCLVLGELIINGAIPQDAKESKEISEIFKQTKGFDELKEVGELKFKPKKPPRAFEHDDVLLLKEPIYAEVYDAKVSNSLEELSVSEESIYAEVYDSHERSTKNLSLEESGYSSISSEEPIYQDVDNFSEQKKPTSLKQKEPEQLSEPIYARVDLSKKRAERKAKDIKANSGTYRGLVQDKVKKWQEQMELSEQDSGRLINPQQTHDRKIETKAGFNVEEIKHKYERRDSGYDSGYDSDTKAQQKLDLGSKVPKSEVGSVSIQCGVARGICASK